MGDCGGGDEQWSSSAAAAQRERSRPPRAYLAPEPLALRVHIRRGELSAKRCCRIAVDGGVSAVSPSSRVLQIEWVCEQLVREDRQ